MLSIFSSFMMCDWNIGLMNIGLSEVVLVLVKSISCSIICCVFTKTLALLIAWLVYSYEGLFLGYGLVYKWQLFLSTSRQLLFKALLLLCSCIEYPTLLSWYVIVCVSLRINPSIMIYAMVYYLLCYLYSS